jgi:hypothetical protein
MQEKALRTSAVRGVPARSFACAEACEDKSTAPTPLTFAGLLRKPSMDLTHQSEADILAIANPIMDNLMDASTAIDYERHTRDFTDRLRSCLSPEQLQRICCDYQSTKGYFTEREFVALFRRPDSVAIVWKQGFSRQPGEFVAEMVLVQAHANNTNDSGGCSAKYLVDHVMVF